MLFLIRTHKTINRRYAQLKNISIFVAVCHTTPDIYQTAFFINIIVNFTDQGI